ncbi:MAG: RNA repair transcriptional activator RtcR [Planctomycetota bacterium]|nr:RNA repair transcriptional activator RtcR [Planctomycetota bacterium]
MKPTVIISNLGVNLDRPTGPQRWERWRPTVSLFQQEDMEPARLVLLHDRKFAKLAKVVEEDIQSVSPTTEVQRLTVGQRDPWDFAEVYASLLDFAESYPFDPEAEDYLIHMTTGTHVVQICLFLLVETGRIPGRLVQTSPPNNQRKRGHATQGTYTIIDLDLSRYDLLATRFEKERQEGVDFLKSGIPTRNRGFNALMDRIEQVSQRSDDAILLTGATGVGKTRLARRVFELKQRDRGIAGGFVEVNCATLRGDAAMSTLFGHTKGAFTGALKDRDGLLRKADKGVLFLDEIGELGLDEQAMLLRALEEGWFVPLGSDTPVHSNFQLLAGTNRNLGEAVRAGTFREDLLARIDLWSFELPSLKDRTEDLEPNMDYELASIGEARGKTVVFNKEARTRFLDFATSTQATWRANFRDFGSALRRLSTLSEGGRISTDLVDEEIGRLKTSWQNLEGPTASGATPILDELLPDAPIDPFERPSLEYALQTCRASKTQAEAGRKLFAISRTKRKTTNDGDRLRKYLARFDLSWDRVTG